MSDNGKRGEEGPGIGVVVKTPAAFATAPICSHYRGPHREWPVVLKLEPIGKPQ
jgi:hypothetical protein